MDALRLFRLVELTKLCCFPLNWPVKRALGLLEATPGPYALVALSLLEKRAIAGSRGSAMKPLKRALIVIHEAFVRAAAKRERAIQPGLVFSEGLPVCPIPQANSRRIPVGFGCDAVVVSAVPL